ncbi:MAG: hypothetical protein ABSH11_07530 [Verrucomicrobiota bacterium]|jgi:hypothetical protein
MDKSQMRVRPGFLLGLVMVFAFLGWLISRGVATEKDKAKAKFYLTLSEERLMASLLGERAMKIGGLTNVNNEFVLNSFITTNKHQFSFATRTNASGEAVDIWQKPFQIKLVGQTNFIIRSAGPDQKFEDSDDIIFNSVSNGFVKP